MSPKFSPLEIMENLRPTPMGLMDTSYNEWVTADRRPRWAPGTADHADRGGPQGTALTAGDRGTRRAQSGPQLPYNKPPGLNYLNT